MNNALVHYSSITYRCPLLAAVHYLYTVSLSKVHHILNKPKSFKKVIDELNKLNEALTKALTKLHKLNKARNELNEVYL